jgi:hypothetical protein
VRGTGEDGPHLRVNGERATCELLTARRGDAAADRGGLCSLRQVVHAFGGPRAKARQDIEAARIVERPVRSREMRQAPPTRA